MRVFIVLLILFSLKTAALEVSNENGVLKILNIPHVLQKPDFCGEACAEMVFTTTGHKLTQDDFFNASKLDPVKGRGCYAAELFAGMKALGIDPGTGWFQIPANSDKGLQRLWDSIVKKLRVGIPVIICSRYSDKPYSSEHFRLIVGYDSNTDEVLFHEPAEKNAAYRRMKLSYLMKIWPLKYRRNKWTVIVFNFDVNKKPEIKKVDGFSNADYAQHILKLKEKLPQNFNIVIQPPFVVVGNHDLKTVRQLSDSTVKWSVDKLKKQFFKKDPESILDIWLFKDKQTYEFYNKKLFGSAPGTPYGYYSPAHKSLVMNISTGGGTLVHEIVHPFMESNFADCPSWFNEGLASLYEQSTDVKGRIVGLTNWRLKGLKEEISSKSLPTFKELLSTTSHQFYNSRRGDNYAQARYLCYYLQEKDLLQKFYKEFTANVKYDPTGYETLLEVLEVKDSAAFEAVWKKWVMNLKF